MEEMRFIGLGQSRGAKRLKELYDKDWHFCDNCRGQVCQLINEAYNPKDLCRGLLRRWKFRRPMNLLFAREIEELHFINTLNK